MTDVIRDHIEIVEGAGHYSLPIRYAKPILADLISA